MLKEIKYFIFLFLIFLFLFFTIKYYFSDNNKKKSYRSINAIEKRIIIYSKSLPILKDDTKDILEYVTETSKKKKKKFYFWELLNTNE